MKKGIALILALCFLLSLSACGQLSSEELQATVPTMTVSAGGQQTAQATSGGGNWTYKGQSLVADALHPLQALDILSENSALSAYAGTEVSMRFSVLPDRVTVTYWSADEPAGDSIPEGQTTEVTFNNNLFSFVGPDGSGDIVLLAQAEWNSYSELSGAMGYGFLLPR